jgi:hypothetical protein
LVIKKVNSTHTVVCKLARNRKKMRKSIFIILFLVNVSIAFKYRRRYFVIRPPEIPLGSDLDPIQVDWLTQKLDHFNSSETRTWKQVCVFIYLFLFFVLEISSKS